jgi:hypothetical protein
MGLPLFQFYRRSSGFLLIFGVAVEAAFNLVWMHAFVLEDFTQSHFYAGELLRTYQYATLSVLLFCFIPVVSSPV